MIKKEYFNKVTFILSGFILFFLISLIGIAIEDVIHNVPISKALTEGHHYFTPIVLGILGAVMGLLFWNRKKDIEQSYRHLFNVNKKFSTYLDHAGDGIYLHDYSGNIVDYNSNIKNELGYNDTELSNIKVYGLDEKYVSIDKYHEVLNLLQTQSSISLESVHKRKNGTLFPVEIKLSKVEIDNQTLYISIARNISDRKKAEFELAESRQKFKVLYENAPLAYQSLNSQGYFIDINPAWTENFGFHGEEVIGCHFSEFMTEYSKPIMRQTFIDFVETGEVKNAEFDLIDKQNRIVTISLTGRISYKQNGEIQQTHCLLTNITEQKKVQEALVSSESRFRMLSGLTFEGIIVHNKGLIIESNKALERILGYSIEDLTGENFFHLFVLPEYHNMVSKYLEWEYAPPYEVKAKRKDGSIISIELESKNMNFEGKLQRITAIRDVTKRREYQDDLQRYHTAVEQSANSILITDKDGVIQYANLKFFESTGYSHDEAIGKKPNILKSGTHSDDFYAKMWNAISKGDVWKGEFCNKNKYGEKYWESTIITPIQSNTNEIRNYIAIKEDITEAKQNETRLLKAIIDTEEKERKRFAEDLHDELGPFLSGMSLYINELSYKDVDYEKRLSIIDYLKHFINEAIDKTRSISHQLMPSILTDYGLKVALESFCNKITNISKIDIEVQVDDNLVIDNSMIEVATYRVCIELINNTIKHSNASLIRIEVHSNLDLIEFTYHDNGLGFDLDAMLLEGKGIGLQNIINRVQSLKGRYTYDKEQDKGILFKFKLPLS